MADNAPEQSGASGTAPGDTLQIPKYRLDEVSNELRRVREELAIKDRLILETQTRMAQPQAREPELPTAEELGLDQQTYKAISKIAERIVATRVAPEKAMLEQQIGMLSARTEKAELLASRGADKEKYLPEIQRRQQDHFRNTGGFLPAEMALKLIQGDEADKRIAALEARLAAGNGAGGVPDHSSSATTSGPGAGGTRELPSAGSGAGGSAGSQQKNFSDLSIEEMERNLEEQFGKDIKL